MNTKEIEQFLDKIFREREDVIETKPFKDDYVLSFDHNGLMIEFRNGKKVIITVSDLYA